MDSNNWSRDMQNFLGLVPNFLLEDSLTIPHKKETKGALVCLSLSLSRSFLEREASGVGFYRLLRARSNVSANFCLICISARDFVLFFLLGSVSRFSLWFYPRKREKKRKWKGRQRSSFLDDARAGIDFREEREERLLWARATRSQEKFWKRKERPVLHFSVTLF